MLYFIPIISVIIPLYNKESTINRAIESILGQGVRDIEIIIVDDGSTDESVARVASLADDRILLIRQANSGPGAARNAGASRARADILAFLDADDEWLPGFLETDLTALSAHADAVAYASSYDTSTLGKKAWDKVSLLTQVPALLPPPDASVGGPRMLDYLNGLHSSSTIVRRTAFVQAGGFYDRNRCLWGEDSYLWGQVLFLGKIYWDPVPRIIFHVEDSSLGFAVKKRVVERPITLHMSDLLAVVRPEYRNSFHILALAIAKDDAFDLMRSGQVWRCLSLRYRYRLWTPRSIAGDIKRYMTFIFGSVYECIVSAR